MPLRRVWQCLFLVLLLATTILGLHIAQSIQIDTDLADIAPATQTTDATKKATQALRSNIEQRIVLLISGQDEDSVLDAEDYLRTALTSIPNTSLHTHSDELAERVINELKPYRFSLLNTQQRTALSKTTAQQIAEQAKSELHSLSGPMRVLSFQDDPLAWHSDTLLSLLPASNSNLSQATFIAPINLSIAQDALNIRTQADLTHALDTAIDKTTKQFNVQIDRSGIFFFAARAAQSSKQDISLISTVSTIGVVLLLLFVFRSPRALLLPILSIGLGVSFAFVVTHALYGKVHVLTIVFGASLIGIVIDYSLHYFYHGANQTGDGHSSEKRALFRALALSLTTSLIGYAALSFSDLQALQKVAVFSCCGLFMAWLSVICLGELALKRPLRTEQTVFPFITGSARRLVRLCSSQQWARLALVVLLAGGAVALIAKPYSDDPRVFFKAPIELLDSERRVANATSDYEPGRYIIIHGQTQAKVYLRYELLLDKIRQTTSLSESQFTSLMNWVPSPAEQSKNYQAQNLLYGSGGAAETLYRSLGNADGALPIQQDYRNASQLSLTPETVSDLLGEATPPLWFTAESGVVSLVLIQKGVNADELSLLLKEADGIEYVNTVERTQQALSSQRKSASTLLLLAYAFVALLMIIRFKTPQAAWLLAVPMCATAMLFIISVLFGLTLNLFHIMALFLVLGFGMDYAIFVRELRDHSAVALQAILLSALTSLLSFGLLALSSIPVVMSFGITLLIGNSFNLFGAFVYARTQISEK